MKMALNALGGILLVSSLVATATADMYDFEVGIRTENTLTMKLFHDEHFPSGINAHVGGYQLTYRGNEESFNHLGTTGYCIEMQLTSNNMQPYKIVNLHEAPAPNGPGGLAMGQLKAGYLEALWGQYFSSVTDSVSNAAFQLAVWEIVHEDPYSWDVTSGSIFTAGGHSAGQSARNLATLWLGEFDPYGPRQSLTALSNQSFQDFVVVVPLPGTFVLASIGLGTIGLAKHIRSRKPRYAA